MTAVIYARYSSDNQREESIEGQIRECTAYAEKNGITVVKHYIDRALSAKTDNRPDFQQMIKDSEKRLFDIVLVWKLDRFARNRYDSAHYEYQLERNHVKLVSATEPISDSPAGIMVKSMLTGMAEYYSAELSEKVVRGMTENVLKGKYNGGTIPIGYTVDEEKFFQIDPLKAPFVVEAFQRYNDGATMKELMNWLNDSGVTTNRNQKFTYNSIQTLLTNRRYIGENRFKDIVMPDSIPVIIEKELFDSVQDKIAKNRRAPARHKAEDDYLLTTKLFCGMCGAMMFGECGTSRNKNVHHYYKCANAKRTKTCKKKTVRKEWLEDLVVNETMKMIRDDDCIRSIVDAVMILQEQENTVLPLLEKQMKDIERGIENLLNAIQEGILTSSTKGRLEKLEAQQKELEIRPLQRISFFNDLYRSGFEAVVIDKGQENHMSMSLFSIIEKPKDTSEIVMNPSLVRSANQFYQALVQHQAFPQMQDLMCKELYGARLLVPVADPQKTTAVPVLTTGKGVRYYPAFTDLVEFGKFDRKHQFGAMEVRFRDLKKYLDYVNGIVVNPFGFALRLDGEKLDRIEKENMKLKVVK